jgi:hypothetical protein
MRRCFLVSGFLLSVFTLPAGAETASHQVQNCWSDLITVEVVDFDRNVIEGRTVTGKVTNNTDIALSAVEVRFELWSDKRPLALDWNHLRELRSISAGLLPKESVVGSDAHFMDDRERQFAREADVLSVRFEVEGAKDIEGNPVTCE